MEYIMALVLDKGTGLVFFLQCPIHIFPGVQYI